MSSMTSCKQLLLLIVEVITKIMFSSGVYVGIIVENHFPWEDIDY